MDKKRKSNCVEKEIKNDHEQKQYKKRVKVVNIEYQIYSCYDIPTFENNSILKEK